MVDKTARRRTFLRKSRESKVPASGAPSGIAIPSRQYGSDASTVAYDNRDDAPRGRNKTGSGQRGADNSVVESRGCCMVDTPWDLLNVTKGLDDDTNANQVIVNSHTQTPKNTTFMKNTAFFVFNVYVLQHQQQEGQETEPDGQETVDHFTRDVPDHISCIQTVGEPQPAAAGHASVADVPAGGDQSIAAFSAARSRATAAGANRKASAP